MADIILGIDPGSRNTGFAVLSEENGTLKAVRCDVIKMADIEEHAERLQVIYREVTNIITSCNPSACAVETPVYGVDPLAMLKLGRAQAAAILAIANCGIPVTEYYPKEVKKSITGNGNASKRQVAFMLRKMVTLPDSSLPDDATDALGVAWCHLMKMKGTLPKSTRKTHQNRGKSSWAEFIDKNPERVRGT